MKLLNEYELSKWAYYECENGNDNSEMRSLITDKCWAYCYCRDIKDRPELRIIFLYDPILKREYEYCKK